MKRKCKECSGTGFEEGLSSSCPYCNGMGEVNESIDTLEKLEMTEDEKGNIVAKAVWGWLQQEKCIKYVPWVLDVDGPHRDALKAAKQEMHDDLIAALERVIEEAVEKMR